MIAASLLQQWFGWPDGSVLTNLIASALWVPLGYVTLLRHLHCVEKGCFRPATVPVEGSVHKQCKKHATKHGNTH